MRLPGFIREQPCKTGSEWGQVHRTLLPWQESWAELRIDLEHALHRDVPSYLQRDSFSK